MRYLVLILTFFAFPAFAGDYESLNEIVRKVCEKTDCALDEQIPGRLNTLSHDAINERVERMGAVTAATDVYLPDPTKTNHIGFNVANTEFEGDSTALGVFYMHKLGAVEGLALGASFATDVNARDQAIKGTVGYSW